MIAGVPSSGVAALVNGDRVPGQKWSGSHGLFLLRGRTWAPPPEGSRAIPARVLPRRTCVFAASGSPRCLLAGMLRPLLPATRQLPNRYQTPVVACREDPHNDVEVCARRLSYASCRRGKRLEKSTEPFGSYNARYAGLIIANFRSDEWR